MTELQLILERATFVLESMAQDCGPIEAEPFASWAKQEAWDVIELLGLIGIQDDDKIVAPGGVT